MEEKRKRYTLEDDKVIKECIKKCSTLTEAFVMASVKLGRSDKSIMNHYYQQKKKRVLAFSKKEDSSMLSRFIASVRNIFTF